MEYILTGIYRAFLNANVP